jgi:hypothetical protein
MLDKCHPDEFLADIKKLNIELSDNYIYLKVLRYCIELLTTFPTVSTVYNNP